MPDADALREREAFGARFLLAPMGNGGIALDRATGAFWRLDGPAWQVAAALADGEPDSAVISRLQLPEEAARGLIADVLGLADAAEPPQGDNPIAFRHDADGHVLAWEGAPLVRVGPGGRWLAPEAPAEDPVAQARLALPDALILRGVCVLHASSALDRGVVRAFLGTSGAGKTTLARAFEAAGARLVSEDLLLVRDGAVPLEGEARLREWCERAGAAFARGERFALSEADVEGFFGGLTAPIGAIHALRARGAHADLRCAPIDGADAVAALLQNALAELGLPEVWERVWADAIALAGAVPAFDTAAPEGIDAMTAAVRDYTSISTA